MSASIDVRLDSSAIRAAMHDAEVEALHRAASRVLRAAQVECPVDEGRLRASLTIEMRQVGGHAVARVGSNLPYARFVHDGTGIYGPSGQPIRPRNGQVLRWPVKNNSGSGNRRYKGGRTAGYAYARSVKGVEGRPFLLNALRRARL